MDFILLALLCLSLVALAVIAWYLRKQLRRFEARFDDFKALRFMPDRIQALAKEMESMQISEVRDELDSIQATLRRIEDLSVVPADSITRESILPRHQQLRALVTRDLPRDYVDIVIDSADEELSAEQVQVSLTAKRNGAIVTGVVSVDNDIITDINLKAHYITFP
ncbi:MAG: hypothetical protein OTI37_03245 [Planctomycetota bacterium]|nr:hypothetical protein [Planctomycetota bacterium]